MIVSEIVELDKKRVKVYIDGEFAFVLYKGELRDYQIKPDNEISKQSYDEIIGTLLPKRATKRAMNLLQKKDYTEKQLRDKLSEGLYSEDCIDAAIEYVKSYRYLDDDRYARDYITYHIEGKSKNKILQNLVNKGISKELVCNIFEELDNSQDIESIHDLERDQIIKLLNKKHYNPEMEYKEKQKIMAFLMRRGYGMDSIKDAMNNYEN